MDKINFCETIEQSVEHPEENMIFAEDLNGDGKKGYLTVKKTDAEVIRAMLKKDRHLYELICDHVPVRFFFDLEIKGVERFTTFSKHVNIDEIDVENDDEIADASGVDTRNALQKTMDSIMFNKTLKTIMKCFKQYYGQNIAKKDLCCLNSCRLDKLSYHVIVKNNVYAKDIKEAGEFAKYVANQIRSGESKDILNNVDNTTIIDEGVYKSRQLMRMVNQSKMPNKQKNKKQQMQINSGILKFVDKKYNKLEDTFITFFSIEGLQQMGDTTRKINLLIDTESKKQRAIPEPLPVIPPPKTDKVLKLEEVDKLIEEGARFISEKLITTTGKCLKDLTDDKGVLITSNEQFAKFPECKQLLYSITTQNDYRIWFAICIASINSGCPLDDVRDFCKLNTDKASDEEMGIIIKSGLKPKGFKIGSLRFFAWKSNPNYYKDRPDNALLDYFGLILDGIELKTENTRYLSSDDDKDHTHNENINTLKKMVVINAGCGSGKTTQIKRIKKPYSTILCVTPRTAFAIFISKEYELEYYKDKKINIKTCDKLAIQLESLTKLDKTKQYELIIIDESESVLRQFDSVTMKSNAKNTFNQLKIYVTNAKKVILADGYIRMRSIVFCKFFTTADQIYMLQNICGNPNNTNVIQLNDNAIIAQIMEDFKAGLNLYVCVCSKKVGDDIYNRVKTELLSQMTNEIIDNPESLKAELDKSILYYSSTSTAPNMKTLHDVNQHWKTKRMILVTPTVTCGVSFSDEADKHFHRTYCVTTDKSCVVADVMQQIFRVRHLKDNVIYFSVKRVDCHYNRCCFVDDINRQIEVTDRLFRECVDDYVNSLDKNSQEYKDAFIYYQCVKESDLDSDLMKIIMLNIEERKLSRLHFAQMLNGFMKQTNFNITLLEKLDKNTPTVTVNYNDDTVKAGNLAKYLAIPTINHEKFDQNVDVIEKKEKDFTAEQLENDKFIFQSYIEEATPDIEKSLLFYKYWQNGKAHFIRNVYHEKNNIVGEMALKALYKTEGVAILSDNSSLKLKFVTEMNNIFGMAGSYVLKTDIDKNTMRNMNCYIANNFTNLSAIFSNLSEKGAKENATSFTYRTIGQIYREFNGHEFRKTEQDLNSKQRDLVTYHFKGENWGQYIKTQPIKPKQIYDDIFNTPK